MPDKLITNYYYLYHKLERLPATAVFLFSPNPDPDKSVKQRKIQRYENFSTINSCTNNNNDIGIRVRTEANGYSDRVSVSVGSTATLPKDITTTRIDAYDLYIRNNVFSPCSAVHSGVWYFN